MTKINLEKTSLGNRVILEMTTLVGIKENDNEGRYTIGIFNVTKNREIEVDDGKIAEMLGGHTTPIRFTLYDRLYNHREDKILRFNKRGKLTEVEDDGEFTHRGHYVSCAPKVIADMICIPLEKRIQDGAGNQYLI